MRTESFMSPYKNLGAVQPIRIGIDLDNLNELGEEHLTDAQK